jgi:DNA-binding MarR family transcriptional regulator
MKITRFAEEVVDAMATIHIELVRKKPALLMKGKFTIPQMIIVEIIGRAGECKMTDISRYLCVTKSAVTGLVDRLIRLGYVKRIRSRRDRRIIYIQLTTNGAQLSRRLRSFRLKRIRDVFSRISAKERSQYLGILKKLKKEIVTKVRH